MCIQMSYYKHKTVQAFQLGNIIPIAPVILVVRQASCLSAGGSFTANQYRSHLLGPKNLARKLPPLGPI
jgi:hypothetical protein